MPPRQPTMHDVAKAAGVSTSTVSRVINNGRYIRPETRLVVERAIAELGFHRNEVARMLRPGQTANTIALVIEDPGNPFWSAITRGAEETAWRNQHMLVVGSTGQDFHRERDLLRDLVSRRVDGLLVVPTAHDHRDLHTELSRRAPMVFIDRVPDGVPADSVVLDNVGGARRAIEYLLTTGHRRIGYIGGDPAVSTGAARLAGYRSALADAGLSYDPGLVSLGNHTVEAATTAAMSLLNRADPPDAIFADNNRICVGVLHGTDRHDRDIAVAGFDDVELVDLLPRSVALITYDAVEIGRRAAELLFGRIDGGTGEYRQLVMPTELVLRGRFGLPRPL
ncbi:LacI family DNA-binding transcriptional regulator [Actinoplanes sp. NPDC049668]|uniref:LacI family DNA-binding transcriptional regulator n=1 Tax=unclassified Actinoplanes TaxID=2626549 RepID=UPI0033B11A0D